MFCNSVRRRPSYSSIIPALISPSMLGLQESQLTTHDIAIPLDVKIAPSLRSTRSLRVLLLSPSKVSKANIEATLERINHFSMSSHDTTAIIFLLAPPPNAQFHTAKQQLVQEQSNDFVQEAGVAGIIAYSNLQAELLNHAFPNIPILPVTKLENLPDVLKKHVTALTTPPARAVSSTAMSYELLGQCSDLQPMLQDTHLYLSDVFDNLRDVAGAMTMTQSPAPNSSSPRTIAAFAESFLSQPQWPEDASGDLQLSSEDEESAKGKMRKMKDLVGDDEMDGLKRYWEGEYTID